MDVVKESPEALQRALAVLREGGTVIHATETCYGLACDLRNQDAVRRLFEGKERPFHQPVSALFASVAMARQYVEWTPCAEELSLERLPGPLTIVLKLRTDAPSEIFVTPDGQKTVGIRISSHPFATALAASFGSPVSTTSANIHDHPTPYDPEEIIRQYKNRNGFDLLIDSGVLPRVPPSTIVDCTIDPPRVVRGAL